MEFKIKHSLIIQKENNIYFLKQLKKYIEENKCCDNLECKHPKFQSNAILHKKFKFLEKSVNEELGFKVKSMWCFFAKKNSEIKIAWHSHPSKFSCVLYLTESEISTIFENFAINLKKNYWLIFPGKMLHTTQPTICLPEDRLIIAADLDV